MALTDWLWLVRLIMEILRLVSQLPAEDLQTIAKLRDVMELPDPPGKNRRQPTKT